MSGQTPEDQGGLLLDTTTTEDHPNGGRDEHHNNTPSKQPWMECESKHTANLRRARGSIEDGQYKKAMQALISDGFAHVSDEVYAEMLAKHPQSSHPSFPVGPCPLPGHITAEGVVGALKSFPSGSAPGPSSFQANHFKEAVFCPSPDRANGALQALVDMVNHSSPFLVH